MLDEGGGNRFPSETKTEKPKTKMKWTDENRHLLWYGLSLRIIALFITAMIVSFSPELFRDIFGDALYPDPDNKYEYGEDYALLEQNTF